MNLFQETDGFLSRLSDQTFKDQTIPFFPLHSKGMGRLHTTKILLIATDIQKHSQNGKTTSHQKYAEMQSRHRSTKCNVLKENTGRGAAA